MNISFILIQLLGFTAWIILLISYHNEKVNKILLFQIISAILFSAHYFLLGGYSGFIISFLEIIRNFVYYKSNKDKYIFLIFTVIYILCGIFTYKSIIGILPFLSSIYDSFILMQKRKVIVLGATISFIIWLIYDIYVGSYSGMITDIITIISNCSILLFNFNIFDKLSKKKKKTIILQK